MTSPDEHAVPDPVPLEHQTRQGRRPSWYAGAGLLLAWLGGYLSIVALTDYHHLSDVPAWKNRWLSLVPLLPACALALRSRREWALAAVFTTAFLVLAILSTPWHASKAFTFDGRSVRRGMSFADVVERMGEWPAYGEFEHSAVVGWSPPRPRSFNGGVTFRTVGAGWSEELCVEFERGAVTSVYVTEGFGFGMESGWGN